jgi:hypothetical protein
MSAADVLLAEKSTLAQAITNAMYAERPQLLEQYGEHGRIRCLEDMHFNIEHLVPAVALGENQLFARYVVWLRDMLAARNVGVDDVRRSLQLTVTVVQQHMQPDDARAVVEVVNAGIAALDQ